MAKVTHINKLLSINLNLEIIKSYQVKKGSYNHHMNISHNQPFH